MGVRVDVAEGCGVGVIGGRVGGGGTLVPARLDSGVGGEVGAWLTASEGVQALNNKQAVARR